MKDRMIVAMFAIGCIAGLAGLWIYMGHNHNSLTVVIGMIGTVTGYAFGSMKEVQK